MADIKTGKVELKINDVATLYWSVARVLLNSSPGACPTERLIRFRDHRGKKVVIYLRAILGVAEKSFATVLDKTCHCGKKIITN